MKVGDVVISKSMNQTMTVEVVDNDKCLCVYFENFNGELKRLSFQTSDLIFVR